MTPEEVAEIRARHYACSVDEGVEWPCDVVRLLDALQDAEAERRELRYRRKQVGELNDKLAWVQGTPYEVVMERALLAEAERDFWKKVVEDTSSLEEVERDNALEQLSALRAEYERVVAALNEAAVLYHSLLQGGPERAIGSFNDCEHDPCQRFREVMTGFSDRAYSDASLSNDPLAGLVPSDAEPEPNDFFEEDEPIEDVRRAWQRSYEGGRTEGTRQFKRRAVPSDAEPEKPRTPAKWMVDFAEKAARAVPSEEQGEPPEPKLHKAWCMETHGKGDCDCGEGTRATTTRPLQSTSRERRASQSRPS